MSNKVILEVKASRLQVGDSIVHAKNKRTVVKTITACTSGDNIHVNKNDCYWLDGIVNIEREVAPGYHMTPEQKLLYAIFEHNND